MAVKLLIKSKLDYGNREWIPRTVSQAGYTCSQCSLVAGIKMVSTRISVELNTQYPHYFHMPENMNRIRDTSL
jgi:hypothetical protein